MIAKFLVNCKRFCGNKLEKSRIVSKKTWFSLIQVYVRKFQSGYLFETVKNSPRNVISGVRYIRNSLYPVRAKSSICCVFVEGDSLAQFRDLTKPPRRVKSGTRYNI